MYICKFTQSERTELDQVIYTDLRKNNMLGQQTNDKQLYMKRKYGEEDLNH